MRKALATFGSGPAAGVLNLALPTLRRYAERHGYELVVGDGDSHGRPPSWGKVPFLRRLLWTYDFVVWLDADTLILDDRTDLESVVPPDAFQAFAVVTCVSGAGTSPCCGVWAFRSGDRAQRFLDEVWAQDDLTDHEWWEQSALMRLTGWTIEVPFVKERDTKWDEGTYFLPEEWDMIPHFPIGYSPGKIRHYADQSNRRRRFDMGTDLAALNGRRVRFWLGRAERRWRHLYRPVVGELRYRVGRQ